MYLPAITFPEIFSEFSPKFLSCFELPSFGTSIIFRKIFFFSKSDRKKIQTLNPLENKWMLLADY